MPSVVVVGSGSLAGALCASLSTGPSAVRVTVLARSPERGAELAYLGATRARLSGAPVTFTSAAVDLTSPDRIGDALAEARPDVVVTCASHHSPWEAQTPWARFVAEAGFGVTLPLQAHPAVTVAGAVRRLDPEPVLVNACFPDAVNPLLQALGLPVLCGIGNVALIAASLAAALDVPPGAHLRVLAHHTNLHAPASPADEAMAWLDDAPVADVGGLLARQRATRRSELNQVGGHAAALFLQGLLSGREVRTSLPGPLGLPGGYPVVVRGDTVALDLPAGLTEDAAIAWNQRAGLADGVHVVDGRVEFAPTTAAALRRYAPELADGFAVHDVDAALERLLALRAELRGGP